jgi:two-component system phosphate regulon response regulator OmpR
MTELAHILIVDDDQRIRDLLSRFLHDQNYAVTAACDAKQARAYLEMMRFDAIVLDIMMPGETGLELAQSIDTRQTPVLLLSALGEAQHRIEGLEKGVQDYLVKPFEPRELLLRLGNIIRTHKALNPAPASEVVFGSFVFHMEQKTLSRNGQHIALTTTEEQLLHALLQRTGEPVSRTELAKLTTTPEGQNTERSVDVQINRLRKKIDFTDDSPSLIRTVRGAGYMIYAE